MPAMSPYVKSTSTSILHEHHRDLIMSKCSCTTKALEILIRDIAGLNVRQQRAQIFFQRHRSFGTRAPLRQVETANLGVADDGFIPFEKTRKLQRSSVQAGGRQEGTAETVPSSTNVEDETIQPHWHAEVEVNDAVSASASAVTNGSVPSAPVDLRPSPEWVKPATQKPLSRKQRVQLKAQDPSRAITEGRRLRKERRMKEGTYRPTSINMLAHSEKQRETQKEREAEEEPDPEQIGTHELENTNEVEDVLAKLDQDLGGPSIIKAQQKRAERLASKSVEKKRKAQLTAAKKHEQKQQAIAEAEAQRKKTMEPWMRDKTALQAKFGAKGWAPNKRLSPDSLEGIRALHSSDPETYDTAMLSQHFQITPEAIRRILKSKWKPQPEEIEKRMERWEARGKRKWNEMSELGMKPPKKWRMQGVPNPKMEGRTIKKWEDDRAENKTINQKTGKKERWRNLEKQDEVENSLAHRL